MSKNAQIVLAVVDQSCPLHTLRNSLESLGLGSTSYLPDIEHLVLLDWSLSPSVQSETQMPSAISCMMKLLESDMGC